MLNVVLAGLLKEKERLLLQRQYEQLVPRCYKHMSRNSENQNDSADRKTMGNRILLRLPRVKHLSLQSFQCRVSRCLVLLHQCKRDDKDTISTNREDLT